MHAPFRYLLLAYFTSILLPPLTLLTALMTHTCIHTGKYVVSVGSDGWHFLDVLREGAFLQGTKNAQWSSDPAARYSCGAFHPDGLILGTGSAAGSLRIWDVRTLENPHSLAGHAGAAMTCLAFSENGYQAASGGADGSVHLWDLRKLAFTQTLQCARFMIYSILVDSEQLLTLSRCLCVA